MNAAASGPAGGTRWWPGPPPGSPPRTAHCRRLLPGWRTLLWHPALKMGLSKRVGLVFFPGKTPLVAGGEAASRGQPVPAYAGCLRGAGRERTRGRQALPSILCWQDGFKKHRHIVSTLFFSLSCICSVMLTCHTHFSAALLSAAWWFCAFLGCS